MTAEVGRAYGVDSAIGEVFREEFLDAAMVAANGATLVGSPVVNRGILCDAAGKYAIYSLNGSDIMGPEFAIWIRFTPAFAHDDGANHVFFDTDDGTRRVLCYKTNGNSLALYAISPQGAFVIVVTAANYGTSWNVGEENTLLLTGDGTTRRAILNGADLTIGTSNALEPCPTYMLTVGTDHGTHSISFDGEVHELRFLRSALTVEDEAQLRAGTLRSAIRPEGSLIHLPCRTGGASEPNVGTLGGSFAVEGATALSPNGYSYDGTNDRLVGPDGVGSGATELSGSAIIRYPALAGNKYEPIMTNWDASAPSPVLLWHRNGALQASINGGTTITPSSRAVPVPVGRHIHVAFVFKGGEYLRVYIDGELVDADTSSVDAAIAAFSSRPLHVGYSAYGPRYGAHHIHFPSIWPTALSPIQVAALCHSDMMRLNV